MEAQRPVPTSETIGRAIDPWYSERDLIIWEYVGIYFVVVFVSLKLQVTLADY